MKNHVFLSSSLIRFLDYDNNNFDCFGITVFLYYYFSFHAVKFSFSFYNNYIWSAALVTEQVGLFLFVFFQMSETSAKVHMKKNKKYLVKFL